MPAEYQDALRELQRGYVVREHNNLARAGATNAALVVDNGLTEFLGPRFLLAGPPTRIIERIEEIASWGVTNFFTSGMFGDPFTYTQAVAEHVIRPLLATG